MRRLLCLMALCLACSAGPDDKSLLGSQIDGYWPSWSPDGQWLSISRDENLWLKPVAGGKDRQASSIEGEEYQAGWDLSDQDGRLVFVNLDNGTYSIIALDISPYELTTWYASDNEITWPCFSNDGSRIFFLEEGRPGIRTIDTAGGIPEAIPNDAGWGQKMACIQPSFIHDRILYVVAREDDSYNVESISTSGGKPEILIRLEQSENYVKTICFASESPDGSKIAYYESVESKLEQPYITSDIKLIIYDKTSGISSTIKEVTVRVGLWFVSPPTSWYFAPLVFYSAAWSTDGGYLAHNWLYGIQVEVYDFKQATMILPM